MQSPVLERLVGGAVLLGLLLLLALVIGPREGARMPDDEGWDIPDGESAPALSENGATAFPGDSGANGERVSSPQWGGLSPAPGSEAQSSASAPQPADAAQPPASALQPSDAGVPAQDRAAGSGGSSAAAAASPAPAGGWAVQVGSFSSRANADQLAKWCREQGYGARVLPGQDSGRTLYRVRAGPYASRDEARAAVAELALLGRSGFVSDWEDSPQ